MDWFKERAAELFSHGLFPRIESDCWKRKFLQYFGVSTDIISRIWNDIESLPIDEKFQKEHLLWTMFFLQNAPVEEVACGIFQIGSRNTWRKWIWTGVEIIASLEYVWFMKII